MKNKVIVFIVLICNCACDSKKSEDKLGDTVIRIEETLGLNSPDEKSIHERLKDIEQALANRRDVTYVLPDKGFEIDSGDTFKATIMVRRFNPLDQRKAAVIINDSVMSLKYDSLVNGHIINYRPTEIGKNECYGLVTYNNGQDTMRIQCDFIVRPPSSKTNL
ncbi:MAG: hypothetical protein NXI09_00940 [Bacteroidetes bacterium]|nr:hypothetical protein [Bacteroidota bacterium]